MKNLVVGAGFSGATIANLLATELNEEVEVIDSKDHIAGNCYGYKDENGITIHKYGSHIFHTNNEKLIKIKESLRTQKIYLFGFIPVFKSEVRI